MYKIFICFDCEVIAMNQVLKSEYMYNPKFKKYVDKYCKKHNCTIKEAFEKKKVKLAFWQYTDL